MFQILLATFEDGVLKPLEALELPPHAKVRLTIEMVDAGEEQRLREEAWASMEKFWRSSKINSRGERLTRDQLHERR